MTIGKKRYMLCMFCDSMSNRAIEEKARDAVSCCFMTTVYMRVSITGGPGARGNARKSDK